MSLNSTYFSVRREWEHVNSRSGGCSDKTKQLIFYRLFFLASFPRSFALISFFSLPPCMFAPLSSERVGATAARRGSASGRDDDKISDHREFQSCESASWMFFWLHWALSPGGKVERGFLLDLTVAGGNSIRQRLTTGDGWRNRSINRRTSAPGSNQCSFSSSYQSKDAINVLA